MKCPHCTKLISDNDVVNDLVDRRIIPFPIITGPEIGVSQWAEAMGYTLIDIDKENLDVLVETPWARKPFWIPLPKRVKVGPFTHAKPRQAR
jgi:hypothetical protein